MNKWIFFILGWCVMCFGREPFKPREKSVPFLVYYLSHYRGICVGTLVSRTTVLTAAVCIANPLHIHGERRPINVITAATYRHPRRGIRVQVTKILIPKMPNSTAERTVLIQKAPALLLLARTVPDILAEVPLRPIAVDYNGDLVLSLHDECLILGWHFFYKGDKIYPVHKFLLQRNIRAQYVALVKKSIWCNTLTLKFQKAMTNIGYMGEYEDKASICVKDPDREAQPCHGMYGAPLICHGKIVGIMTAPEAQWTNCTGYTTLIHLIKSDLTTNFMRCVSRDLHTIKRGNLQPIIKSKSLQTFLTEVASDKTLFVTKHLFLPQFNMQWEKFKKHLEEYDEESRYDYLPQLYDRVMYDSSSSEEA